MKRFLLFLLATVTGYACYAQCSLDLGQDTVFFCQGDTLQLSVGLNWSSVNWFNGQSSQSIELVSSSVAWVEVEDINGCIAADTVVAVSIFFDTHASEAVICEGEEVDLWAGAFPKFPLQYSIIGVDSIPDGSGQVVESTIQINDFSPGTTYSMVGDQLLVSMEIEHSYLGDLEAAVICPSGDTAVLFNSHLGGFIPGGFGGGGTYLGDPIDGNLGVMGVPWCYGFSDESNWETLGDEFFAGNITQSEIDSGNTMPSGVYTPESEFTTMNGCPMNGEWKLVIKDNIGIDDGYLSGWGISFVTDIPSSSYWWSTTDTAAYHTANVDTSLVWVEMTVDTVVCVDTLEFDFNPLPIIDLDLHSSSCDSSNGQILSIGDSLLVEIYNWAGVPVPQHLLDPGLYDVSLFTPAGCQVDTTVEILLEVDSASNITGSTVTFTNQLFFYSVPHNDCLEYAWTIDNGVIVSGQGTHQVEVSWNDSISGWIAVHIGEQRGFSQNLILYVGTATDIETPPSTSIQAFPNPVNTMVRITSNQEIQQFSILDLSGRTIQSISTNSRTVDVDMEHFSRGPYVIRILSASGESSKLMIKD